MTGTSQGRNAVFNANRFKLGVFGTNSRGIAHTTAPDRYRPTWDNVLDVAQTADRAGFEAMLAFARWKGASDGTVYHQSGYVLEPFTWAAALAQATSHLTVFATTHAPTMHPILAAKQSATVDIISGGRFGLNIVGGWNRPEFDMFGQPLADHDTRYDYLEEWLGVMERLWSSDQEFDHEGTFLKLKGAMSNPHPLQRPRPPIMNAGGSGRGQLFACEHADICFVGMSTDPEIARKSVASYKTMAREKFGREVAVWALAIVAQRETRQEAENYFHHFSVEHEDKVGVDAWFGLRTTETRNLNNEPVSDPSMRLRVALGGAFPLVGSAQDVADKLQSMSDIGVDGCLLAWNNYADGIRRFRDGVMPLLEERGLRVPFENGATVPQAEVSNA